MITRDIYANEYGYNIDMYYVKRKITNDKSIMKYEDGKNGPFKCKISTQFKTGEDTQYNSFMFGNTVVIVKCKGRLEKLDVRDKVILEGYGEYIVTSVQKNINELNREYDVNPKTTYIIEMRGK